MVLVFSIFALFVFIGCLLEIIKYKKTNPFSKNTNSFSWKMALISILPIIIIQLSLNSSANQLFSLISLLFSFALASLLSFFIKPEFAYLKNILLLFLLRSWIKSFTVKIKVQSIILSLGLQSY